MKGFEKKKKMPTRRTACFNKLLSPLDTVAQVRKEGHRKDSFDGLKVKVAREGVLIPIDNSTALLDKLVWWSPRPYSI